MRFAYTARDRAGTRREVEPHSLVNAGRRWYLVAFDCGRDDWRTFRVDRIAKPASTGARFHPRELPAKDAAAFVSRSLQSYPSRYEARVTVECPAAELEGRRWLGGDVTPLDDNRCELRTSDDNLDWLATRIAMLTAALHRARATRADRAPAQDRGRHRPRDLNVRPELRDHARRWSGMLGLAQRGLARDGLTTPYQQSKISAAVIASTSASPSMTSRAATA